MKAVILVGGEGTRLRPLTYFAPKQMLPILGVPMLERVFMNLKRHGVTEVVLSLGYMPDRFIERYPDFTIAGIPVSYAVEPEPLDTAGAIRFAALHAKIDDTFLVLNGDVLTDLDVSALVAFHRSHGGIATIALHPVDDPSRFGVVVTDDSGRVEAFIEKPKREDAPSNLINAGTYVMEPAVLDFIEPDVRVSVERMTFPALAAAGQMFAMSDDSYWLDTGTPQAYLTAHADILSGDRALDVTPAVANGSWVATSAVVDPSASLRGATIDEHCVVGANVTLENVVLFSGVRVEDGAVLRDSIVGNRAVIGAGVHLGPTCVIGNDEVIGAGTSLEGDVRVGGPK